MIGLKLRVRCDLSVLFNFDRDFANLILKFWKKTAPTTAFHEFRFISVYFGSFGFFLEFRMMENTAAVYLKINTEDSAFKTRFISNFGVSPSVMTRMWNLIDQSKIRPKHLLYGCHFLKVYSTENVHVAMFDVDPKTFRKWSWKAIELMAFSIDVSHFRLFIDPY